MYGKYKIYREKRADYFRIKDKDPNVDKYYRTGIPYKFWESHIINFRKIHLYETDSSGNTSTYFKKTIKAQEKTFKEILSEDFFEESLLIVMTSELIDDAALALGAQVAKNAISLRKKVLFWNSASFIPYDYYEEHDESLPDLIVIYNVTEESNAARMQKIRDMLYLFNDSLKIVCGSGTNPVDFSEEKLRMAPDLVFYADDKLYTVKKSY